MNLPGAILALALSAVAASAQEVKLDYDHDVDFSRYKTFGWSVWPSSRPRTRRTTSASRGPWRRGSPRRVSARIRAAFPDAYLMYTGRVGQGQASDGAQQRQLLGAHEPAHHGRPSTRSAREPWCSRCTTTRTKDIVWRGVASGVSVRDDAMEEVIRAAVKKLLEGYPPKKAEDRSPDPQVP